ncbi:hypothetical protein SJI45_18975 [Streptomyces sp. S399]|uniref:hypothetical protein n=1 Tax=Streptomyces sp. S399 TaxID=3096009 RepID=UPI002A7F1924|nr:hypothetical protein [Streptomyces sp. S399]WPR52820.1 hypothetical protein SJI45_18975 [Streptomyces sp. S399]
MKQLQRYETEVNLRTHPGGELSTIYWDFTGPAGLPDTEVHARAWRAAREEVPGCEIVGSRVMTDGRQH